MEYSQGFQYRPIEAGDYQEIATLVLRESDQLELIAASGLSPQKALQKSVAESAKTWVILYEGRIEGVGGVTEYRKIWRKTPYGVPWLLVSDKFPAFKVSLAKEAKRFVQELSYQYPLLMNFVDSRNTVSIRWLKWLGFTVDEAHYHFLHDPAVPFYRFHLRF